MSTWMIYSSIGVWFAMVATLVVFAALAGVPGTLTTCAFALVVGLMPPAMMFRLSVAAEPQGCVVPHLAGKAR